MPIPLPVFGSASGTTDNPEILIYANPLAPTGKPDIGHAIIFPGVCAILKRRVVQVMLSMAGGIVPALMAADSGKAKDTADNGRNARSPKRILLFVVFRFMVVLSTTQPFMAHAKQSASQGVSAKIA